MKEESRVACMYVSAPVDPSPPSTSNFIPELPRFVIFMVMTNWSILSIVTAVVSENMITVTMAALTTKE